MKKVIKIIKSKGYRVAYVDGMGIVIEKRLPNRAWRSIDRDLYKSLSKLDQSTIGLILPSVSKFIKNCHS